MAQRAPHTPRAKAEVHQVAKAVTWAERELELTDVEIGRALGGASTRTVARWRERAQRPHPPAVVAAESLLTLSHALQVVFGNDRERMQAWLHEPVPAFRGRTPLRLIAGGEAAKIVTLLANIDAGVFA